MYLTLHSPPSLPSPIASSLPPLLSHPHLYYPTALTLPVYQKYKLSLRAYTTSHETHTASLDLQIRKLEKALITAQQMLDEVKKDKAEAEKAFEARKRVLRENLGVGREVMWERDWWESSDEEFDDLE